MIEARHMNRTSSCEDALASATQSLDAWLVQNLDHFSPFGLEQGDKLCYKLKAFDELCMYSAIADERNGEVPIPREIHDFVASVCENPRYLSTIVSSPRELLLYIYPIIYMVQKQLPSWREMRAYALSVISSDLYFSTERLPCRILDSLFCLWQLDPGNEKLSLFENAWSVGSGAHPPHAGWSTATEYYSYTHSIFFGTKFGLDSISHGRNRENEKGEDAIELGILRFLSEQNIDLALELVLCQMLLNHKDAIGGLALCLSHLFADVNLHGYVAGPTPVGVELFSDLEKNWFCNYHTSLVAALVLRYARARYMPDLLHSLKELETSQIKLATLSEVGSIFSRMASAEVTRSGAHDMLVDVRHNVSPELTLRIERHLGALSGVI